MRRTLLTARRSTALIVTLALTIAAIVVGSVPAAAASKAGAPSASFTRLDLSKGAYAGTALTGGTLTLSSTLAGGTYSDPFGHGAVAYQSGTWTSLPVTSPFAFDELVASWNATTPDGTWIKIEMEAGGSGRTTKFYVLGIWASGDGTIHRTSVSAQGDDNGFIAIDTFIRAKKAAPLNTYRLRLTLYRANSAAGTLSPSVRFLSAMTSAESNFAIPSASTGVDNELAVPPYSQEIHAGDFPEYDGGGEAWCSPTSTAMVLGYWETGPTAAQLADFPLAQKPGHPDPWVDYAARYVYDWNYQGAGNWPYNTAYAATFGLNAFVTRLRSLAEAERFIAEGIPLVASINGKLPGFLFKKTSGHLLVIIGFTSSGDVITNDPAVLANEDAHVIYGRADFEKVWLEGSAGIVYVIYDDDKVDLPPNVEGLDKNW
jgi:hypothetical protein